LFIFEICLSWERYVLILIENPSHKITFGIKYTMRIRAIAPLLFKTLCNTVVIEEKLSVKPVYHKNFVAGRTAHAWKSPQWNNGWHSWKDTTNQRYMIRKASPLHWDVTLTRVYCKGEIRFASHDKVKLLALKFLINKYNLKRDYENIRFIILFWIIII